LWASGFASATETFLESFEAFLVSFGLTSVFLETHFESFEEAVASFLESLEACLSAAFPLFLS
jgi:hypothetical protein